MIEDNVFFESCELSQSTTNKTDTTTDITDSTQKNQTESNTKDTENFSSSSSQHLHDFVAATCTAPKTCFCGITEGKANGHNWKDATCSEPKKCTVCGTTSGLTAGHSFLDGKCMTCGKTDPDYIQKSMVWIPTKGGTKYHTRAGCSNMEDPERVTLSEAEMRGFTPCKRCY